MITKSAFIVYIYKTKCLSVFHQRKSFFRDINVVTMHMYMRDAFERCIYIGIDIYIYPSFGIYTLWWCVISVLELIDAVRVILSHSLIYTYTYIYVHTWSLYWKTVWCWQIRRTLHSYSSNSTNCTLLHYIYIGPHIILKGPTPGPFKWKLCAEMDR